MDGYSSVEENRFELTDGRLVPVAAEHYGVSYHAWVLHDVEAANPWLVTWTDGINHWLDAWPSVEVAFARLAALVCACDQQTFLVHHGEDHPSRAAFRVEVERFLSRTVHASGCAPGCDGTDPVNHRA